MKQFSKRTIYLVSSFALIGIFIVCLSFTLVFHRENNQSKSYDELVASFKFDYVKENYNKFEVIKYAPDYTVEETIKVNYSDNESYYKHEKDGIIKEIKFENGSYTSNFEVKDNKFEEYIYENKNEHLKDLYIKYIFVDYDMYLAFNMTQKDDTFIFTLDAINYTFDLHGVLIESSSQEGFVKVNYEF